MALIRCTCIYRASTPAERQAGKAVITVAAADPWCPAATSHARFAEESAPTVVDQRPSGSALAE